LKQSASWCEKLTFNLINAGGRALTTAAIEGGDLEDALRGALLGGRVPDWEDIERIEKLGSQGN